MATSNVRIVKDADPATEIFTALMYGAWYLIVGAAVVVHWALLFPMLSVPVAAAVAAGVVWDWPAGVGVAGVAGAGIMLWRLRRPEMFERWVTRRARARFLTWWRYKLRWAPKLAACKLTVTDGNATHVPRLLSVRIGEHSDRLTLRMLEGQCPADYDQRVDRLEHAFRALECRAHLSGPGTVELAFRRADALAATVTLPRVDHWTKDKDAA
ncbi:hypothetical protein [Nocardia cyriacigeorgica]|uniref:hypothetical protein n=1 Tax=Nocardia cyriacigeorgica TaxID=135487 RepID=UPI001895FA5D|nr:hypothetical protein [Nocardia cyriacigeorgica]MBF6287816.1 hypothetical protein [Nocardia cyriacigeorgica]